MRELVSKITNQAKKHPYYTTAFITASIYDTLSTILAYYGGEGKELSPLIAPVLDNGTPETAAILMSIKMSLYLAAILYLWATPTLKNTGFHALIALTTAQTLAGTNNLLSYLHLNQYINFYNMELQIILISLAYLSVILITLKGMIQDHKNQQNKTEKLPQPLEV